MMRAWPIICTRIRTGIIDEWCLVQCARIRAVCVTVCEPRRRNAGSVVALTKLGPLTIHNLLLPNLKSYMARLEPELNDSKPLKRLEASKGRVTPPLPPTGACTINRPLITMHD